MFRRKMKPDYTIILNEKDEFLVKKFGNADDLSSDQRYKLSTLVDIYSGDYHPELKSDKLALLYSEALLAFCHFDGKWMPEGCYRFIPPTMTSQNEILDAGNKFECISESITTLLHGDEALARHPHVCNNVNLLDEYIKTSFEQEREIINQCFIPGTKHFDVSKYISDKYYRPEVPADTFMSYRRMKIVERIKERLLRQPEEIRKKIIETLRRTGRGFIADALVELNLPGEVTSDQDQKDRSSLRPGK